MDTAPPARPRRFAAPLACLLLLTLLALAPWSTAHAQVYKCAHPSGNVEFSDVPCSKKSAGGPVQLQDNTLDSSASREQALRLENQQLRQQLERLQASQAETHATPAKSQADLQAQRIDSVACERAKRDYEVAASSISDNHELIAARRSAMYGTCGLREPDQTVIIHRTARPVPQRPLPLRPCDRRNPNDVFCQR